MNTYKVETIEYKNIDTEEKYEERDVVFWFDVPVDWAENWCKENGYKSFKVFDEVYVWEDSWDMYCSAKADGVVMGIEITEDELVYGYDKGL